MSDQTVNEPNAQDWANVGNDLRRTINMVRRFTGQPPMQMVLPTVVPNEEDFRKYDKVIPGSSLVLKQLAFQEMKHRLSHSLAD